ncbi:armadillo-type protein [Neohortaea acidophila]|uniref:Armadillo-type protein n=1 Tax=Neohortaea acidophila TaxID=245834 RepID=A0A6A6PYZ2_9PEZI|nr:armadillo-type protein [Neohortaea acidophila]KAF2484969.1 armadillo-type protein [Neohortaea acidophila]
MSANQQPFAPVLSALATMQSNVGNAQKGQAHSFLEQFQKSSEAWTSTFAMLQATQQTSDEAKLFAATTLKGKIVFDFHQLPKESHEQLRDTLLQCLASYAKGPKPIRTQLCVCLANLAIQMLEWKDVLQMVVSTLGSNRESLPCVLEFLHVLPEEVTEGRKINLTEDELRDRTTELLEDNAPQVLRLLTQYAESSAEARNNPQLMDCITSWTREIPLNDIVNSPLMDVIMDAVRGDTSFDAAVETLCAVFKETREVDENMSIIKSLYPRLATLQPRIQACAEEEDWDTLKGVTRVFAEAGEAWVMLIVREPAQYRALVECILECCLRDRERDALSQTFNFWFELKQYITLDRYMEARLQFVDLYSKLVDIMIGHLEYPESRTNDYFDGDREAEEKFREFRHLIGDVLKDCCEVIGTTECLQKSYVLIEAWVNTYGPQANNNVPKWQKLEAPLFSMRAMGRMVPPDESIMLPRLIPLIVQIPDHHKVRFQAVMALGRYTEWTAKHPDTLQEQLNFIMACFSHADKEVIRAAALSFKFFCNDCAALLKDYMPQLQQFYESNLDTLPSSSQEEVSEGVASVLNMQPLDTLYASFKSCCEPVVKRLMAMAQAAAEKEQKLAIADRLNLVTIFIQTVAPQVEPSRPHPVVQYCQEIFPILAAICEGFVDFVPIVERVCRCWRYMVLSYRIHTAPLLPQLAEKLAAGFTASRQGCFLWATDSIVREFSDVSDHVSQDTTTAIYTFYEQQATTFLRALNDLPPEELPDVIEDFFRLSADVLLYHPDKLLLSNLMPPILSAASTSLTLLKEEPLIATLHFLRDFLAYGSDAAPSSTFDPDGQYRNRANPAPVRENVHKLVLAQGEPVTQRCMTGMMYTFPADCFPDASGVLLALFQLLPREVAAWTAKTVSMLPEGSVAPQEQERLLRNIQQRIESGEVRRVRTLLQDFTNSYRRRNVAPREGLGRLEATRFRFAG